MKSKKNKLSNRERDEQLNYLFKSVYELSQELRMTRSLFENYIIWKKRCQKIHKAPPIRRRKKKIRGEASGTGNGERSSRDRQLILLNILS